MDIQAKRFILIAALIIGAAAVAAPAMAATTTVHVVRYASDNTTILNETTVDYTWMETNLPVLGDGSTHYYSQGPTFNESDYWDDTESVNIVPDRDWGAVKGTDVKDLCNLVGGAETGEAIKIKAIDGFSKTFPSEYIYSPDPRQGPMGITWYRSDDGYVPSYLNGMRLVMFADAKTDTPGWNASGWHVFGDADMRDVWAPPYWANFSGTWPSSGQASIKTVSEILIYSKTSPPPAPTIIYNGTVCLVNGTFVWTDNAGAPHTVNNLTPLAALQVASQAGGFTYNGSWHSSKNTALLDWINNGVNNFTYNSTPTPKLTWNYQKNGVYQNYFSSTTGISNNNVTAGDYLEFYYGPDQQTTANATAFVRIRVTSCSAATVIYNGTVCLVNGTFTWTDNAGAPHTVNNLTPLAALQVASQAGGFTYNGSWHSSKNTALLDWINNGVNNFTYNSTPTPKLTWNYQKNGVYQNYFSSTTGISNNNVTAGDFLEFYYGPDQQTTDNATALVRIWICGNAPQGDWTLTLLGNQNRTVTKTYFEQGLACPGSAHLVNWTDADGGNWSGIPLWLLVGMVDDNPDVGPDHFNFNDTLAAQGYSVKITASDGYNTTLASADIARNSGYIVANKLNGTTLPAQTAGGKLCWPLHLKGPAVFGGQQVGNITTIELTGMPQPAEGWTLTMEGDVVDVITQQYFEQAIICHHNVTYTDGSARTWGGVPLWDLVGSVDDIETSSHWTFNDTRANVTGYTVRVIAGDGFNATFTSANVSHNNGFIIANTLNGSPLSGSDGNLKLVGPATTSGMQRVGNVTTIRLEGLPSYPDGAYNLTLKGRISDTIMQAELEDWINCHNVTYVSGNDTYRGIPLWRLCGWVDDRIPHGPEGFNDAAASDGYKILVKAGDGYSKEFQSATVARNDNIIVANTLNGSALPTTGSHPPWPLRLVGSGLPDGSSSVGNMVEIELTDFNPPSPTAAPVHIIKYGPDGTTIVNETNVTYQWMEANLPVIGDGTTVYRFEAITNNPADVWDQNETYPGGNKVANAVKGSRISQLCDLVGGMGAGTNIKLIASDGYETTLPYGSVYTNPAVQARQGDAILAWWGDGQYVPNYPDGMRLFFMPDDHIYGQWDMHETLSPQYWHYYYQDGVMYPSCAGLSSKYITTIKVYSIPSTEWTLELDGRAIGGINYTVSKTYFEQALACQMGANHSATYTDSQGRVWGGMALWFLCGFVDDADQHSNNAYNQTLAESGYRITVTATDGTSCTLDSRDTIRSWNYIVANSLNGTLINESDSSWPLRLVGLNATGSKSIKKIKYINLTPFCSAPVANFTANVTSGRIPLAVQFNDTSANSPTGWNWTFGDGGASTSRNPVHTYAAAGTYPVSLTVSNDCGSDDEMKNDYIVVELPSYEKIGTFKDGTFVLDINGNNGWDGPGTDRIFLWTTTDWTPLMGDWNGDGKAEIGTFKDGTFVLDMNGNNGWDGPDTDRIFLWTTTDWTPLMGDWNGDGTDEIGTFKDGTFVLDMNGNNGWDGPDTDRIFLWTTTDWTPLMGDWNGDGTDEIGTFKDGTFVLDINGNNDWDGPDTDRIFLWTTTDWKPLMGDWNGDGTDEIGTFKDGAFVLDMNGNSRWDGSDTDQIFLWTTTDWTPLVGDWK